jgi:hypothetical protein
VVGLTRHHRVRRRLRAIKNCLAITLGRLAKVRKPCWTGMGHVFFRFSGRDFFLDLDGCHDAMIFLGFST